MSAIDRRPGAWIALVVAGLVLAVCAACAPDTPPAALPPGALDWEPCGGLGWAPGARCADLPVPLDHARPDGPRITVRVSWTPAADPARRRGVLFANPGGPGNPGLRNAALDADPAPEVASALAGYDLVGFDPRGVGASTPVSCGLSPEQALAAAIPTPSREGPAHDAALAASAADACARHGGPVLAHMSTADVAADMDLLRRAIGAPTVSYYGSSYGTYLGVVYDTLYPGRLDRVVLDSLVDSEHGWFDQTRQAAAATETRFDDYAAWEAARTPGSTPAQVRASTLALFADRQRAPLTDPAVVVDGTLLRQATYALVGRNRFEQLEAVLRCAGRPAGDPCLPAVAAALGRLRDDAADDRSASTFLGVTCSDSPWPRDPAVYTRAAAEDAVRYPVTAGGFAQVGPCASWPVPARPAVTASAQPRPPHVLLLNNTRDRISTLAGARTVRAALGDRARLVTVEGWNHQILSNRDPCADRMMADWLGAGRLPAGDVSCNR